MQDHYSKTIFAFTATVMLGLLPWPADDGHVLAQVGLPGIQQPLDATVDRLDRRLPDRIDRRVQEKLETLPVDEPDVEETISEALDVAQTVTDELTTALRPLVAAIDPAGYAIEANRLVLLLPAAQLEALRDMGLLLQSRRDLEALDLLMITVVPPADVDLVEVLAELRAKVPEASVDFNHLYQYAAPVPVTPDTSGGPDSGASTAGPTPELSIGMIDSAVQADHPDLQDSRIISAGFSAHEGRAPLDHGTAVASLLVAAAGKPVELHAASVFSELENRPPTATAEGIVAALDWLAAQQTSVVNLSLTGPPNELLRQAISAVVARGMVVVAAVGNNGPHGEALYPAAYAEAIGVTAVSADGQLFLYANRGMHVEYAALGVDVSVAATNGGHRTDSGTSMAAPQVTVAIAQLLHSGPLPLASLRARLTATARDLGPAGFDPDFGHGWIVPANAPGSRP